MKRIKVAPVEEIAIELTDKTYVCSFNMLAMAYMQEEIVKLDCNFDEVPPARTAAMILYAGIKSKDPSFTMDEANALVVQMGAGNYGDILGSFTEAVFNSLSEESNDLAKKEVARYLSSALS